MPQDGVRLGIVVPNRGPHAVANVRTVPARLEAIGIHSAWFTDHVVGVRSFVPVYGPEWAESLVSLSYAAATTSSIRLAVGVLVVPYRHPVLAAKTLATLDGLSGGRLVVGIGTGWSRSEFDALGRLELFEQRGDYTDEALEVMCRCWEGGEFGWEGRWIRFRRMVAEPTPLQRPHPPLWIGGNRGHALRRAARWADAWHPTRLGPEEVAAVGDALDARAGRAVPRAPRIRVPLERSVEDLAKELHRYEESGAVEVVMELETEDGERVVQWATELAAAMGVPPGPPASFAEPGPPPA
jgi:probable F420-dependent oxidoreductase